MLHPCRNCSDGGLHGRLAYSTDLFEANTAARMAEHLSMLCSAAAAQPDAAITSLQLASQAEQELVLRGFNQTAGPMPTLCVQQYFERQTAANPHATCLIDSNTGSSLTYMEVNLAANRLARHLTGVGVAAEVPVAIFMDKVGRDIQQIVLCLHIDMDNKV
jgi:non-ribosomal peptide synthetase component F